MIRVHFFVVVFAASLLLLVQVVQEVQALSEDGKRTVLSTHNDARSQLALGRTRNMPGSSSLCALVSVECGRGREWAFSIFTITRPLKLDLVVVPLVRSQKEVPQVTVELPNETLLVGRPYMVSTYYKIYGLKRENPLSKILHNSV